MRRMRAGYRYTAWAVHFPAGVFLLLGEGDGPWSCFTTFCLTALAADDKSQVAQVDVSAFTGTTEDLTKQTIQEWDLSGEEPYSEREMFIYYCYSLQFVVALCNGRNSLARDQILAASRWAVLPRIVWDNLFDLPTIPHLKAAVASLQRSLSSLLLAPLPPGSTAWAWSSTRCGLPWPMSACPPPCAASWCRWAWGEVAPRLARLGFLWHTAEIAQAVPSGEGQKVSVAALHN